MTTKAKVIAKAKSLGCIIDLNNLDIASLGYLYPRVGVNIMHIPVTGCVSGSKTLYLVLLNFSDILMSYIRIKRPSIVHFLLAAEDWWIDFPVSSSRSIARKEK